MTRLIALLVLVASLVISGCATMADARYARGKGESLVVDAPFDTVWAVVPQVLSYLGLPVAAYNKQDGHILAERGITAFSWGEKVAVFVERVGETKTKVEVVSKRVVAMNITAPNWAPKILQRIEQTLAERARAGAPPSEPQLRLEVARQAPGSSSPMPPKAVPASPGALAAPVPVSDVDKVPTVSRKSRKNAYAVVIGIESYREKLPKADFAERDAKLVGEYLTRVLGYPEENVIVRTNDRATRTDLAKYFENWLPNNVEKDSSVFVYYSGHGTPNTKTGEAYLVPYDGDPTFVETTAYPMKQLYAALDKLPVKDITVVLDSCFSGAGGRSVLAKGARPMVLSMENVAMATGKAVVLTASGGDQISNSFEEQGHGLLTYYFLKGLQGEGDANKDGTIEMVELYDYVKPNVQRIARKQYNNEQTPQLIGSPERLQNGGGQLVAH